MKLEIYKPDLEKAIIEQLKPFLSTPIFSISYPKRFNKFPVVSCGEAEFVAVLKIAKAAYNLRGYQSILTTDFLFIKPETFSSFALNLNS